MDIKIGKEERFSDVFGPIILKPREQDANDYADDGFITTNL